MPHYYPDEIKLANELASTLRDWDAFPLFLTYVNQDLLRDKPDAGDNTDFRYVVEDDPDNIGHDLY